MDDAINLVQSICSAVGLWGILLLAADTTGVLDDVQSYCNAILCHILVFHLKYCG